MPIRTTPPDSSPLHKSAAATVPGNAAAAAYRCMQLFPKEWIASSNLVGGLPTRTGSVVVSTLVFDSKENQSPGFESRSVLLRGPCGVAV